MVSIVIPVYNQEEYISSCLDTVCAQTYPNIEILVVDDGSWDKSAEIIRSFAERDGRIRYLYQENQGVSVARNTGIAAAKGEYIIFVDGDDMISPELVEKAVGKMEETGADLVSFGAEKLTDNGKRLPMHWYDVSGLRERTNLGSIEEHSVAIEEWLVTEKIQISAWNKIYRRDVIVQNNVRFPENVKVGEDFGFLLCYMLYAKSVVAIEDVLYEYVVHDGSAMTSFGFQKLNLNDFSRFLEIFRERFVEQGGTNKHFCKIFLRTMENQYYKTWSPRIIHASVREIRPMRPFRRNTFQVMFRPWLFVQEYGKIMGLRKWLMYIEILCFTFR